MDDILALLPTEVLGAKEEELNDLLNDVRNEVEENEMVHGLPLKVPRYVASHLAGLFENAKIMTNFLCCFFYGLDGMEAVLGGQTKYLVNSDVGLRLNL